MSCAAHPSFCSKAPKGPCARRNTPPSIGKHQENPSQTGQETTSGLGWERDGNAAGSCCPGTLLAITVGGDAAASSSGSALGDAAAGAHRRKRERRGRGHCRSGGRRVDQHAHEAALRATPPRPRAIQRQTARRRSRSQRPRRAVRAARNLFLDHFDRAGHDAMQTIRALRRRSIAAPQVEPSRVPWRERVTIAPRGPRSTPLDLAPLLPLPPKTRRAFDDRARRLLRPDDHARRKKPSPQRPRAAVRAPADRPNAQHRADRRTRTRARARLRRCAPIPDDGDDDEFKPAPPAGVRARRSAAREPHAGCGGRGGGGRARRSARRKACPKRETRWPRCGESTEPPPPTTNDRSTAVTASQCGAGSEAPSLAATIA